MTGTDPYRSLPADDDLIEIGVATPAHAAVLLPILQEGWIFGAVAVQPLTFNVGENTLIAYSSKALSARPWWTHWLEVIRKTYRETSGSVRRV